MANLSSEKRKMMLSYLERLKNEIDDEQGKSVLADIEAELDEKRYGLVWEEHSEELDSVLEEKYPVFNEIKELQINDQSDYKCNYLIEGDNLCSLLLMQKTHREKVDLIYIDPPYNTGGKDFVYNDAIVDKNDGFRHSKWLSFMSRRLKLARNLLKNDGLIFISIDDNQLAALRLLCDEIFGENNFVDNIIWKKRYGGGAKEKHLVTLQEYILVFAKDISNIPEITVPLSQESIERYYKMKDENFDIRGGFRTHPLEANKTLDERINLQFPIQAPDGSLIYPKRQWLWSQEHVNEALEKGELYFSKAKNGEWSVQTKQYLKDENGQMRRGKFFSIIDNIYTQHGTNELLDMFGDAKIFSFPKPTELIIQILSLCGKKDALVLDFFAGSGTTGQAVLKFNERYGTNYSFILCTNNENNICREVTYQRIKKSVEGFTDRMGKHIDGIPANIKFYEIEFVEKQRDDFYSAGEAFTEHVREMVQIEYGLDFTDERYLIFLSEEELDLFVSENPGEELRAEKIFLSSEILMTEAAIKLFADAEIVVIPDYYFSEELKEVGEL